MSDTLKILFVEDVQTDAMLGVREMRRSGMNVEYRRVDTEPAFVASVADFKPDIILSDYSMPEFDGMAALGLAKATCPHIPFIFVSGTLGEDFAIRALKKGAADYVLKNNLIRLPAAVTRAIAEATERRERRSMEVELGLARQRLASIVEALDDAVWSWSVPVQVMTYIGPAALRIFGYDPDEICANPRLWRDLVHESDRVAVQDAWQCLLSKDAPFDLEYRIVKADGDIRWINNRARMVRTAVGTPDRVDGIIRDITDKMAAQERIGRLMRIRALSSAVNSAIVRLRQRKALLDRICEVALEVGQFSAARVVLVGESGKADIVAAHGVNANEDALFAALARHNDNPSACAGIINASLMAGRTVIENALDETGMPLDSAAVSRPATASFPLVVKARTAGVLILNAADQVIFDQDEIRLLEELSANIAFALELIEHQERIDYLAYYDVLTGLPNRTLFNDRLSQALTAAIREGEMLALVVFNVVELRSINENFGERAGDAVLRQVSERLKKLAQDPASVARLGGDFFALMITGVTSLKEVAQLLDEERFHIHRQPFECDGREIVVAMRSGVALFPNDSADADTLLHNAEAALGQARDAGENLLFYSADANVRVAERRKAENRMLRAVENQEFELHFQPKLDLGNGGVVGLEALLRWNDPEKGQVLPAQFIYLLEDTGLILEVGRWAMKEAVIARREWQKAGLPAPRIAVNVSALQLKDKRFTQDVADALAAAPGDVGLDLEITESMLMESVDEGAQKLRTIRDMGVHIAIDDFGMGYSSLSYISTLPINTLKIDRSFIDGMTDNPVKTSIVTTIISLGHALRMNVVAEGVENEAQSQLLRLLGCDQIQGYLISRPLAAANLAAFLKQSR
jgi:diguanylate cyclase (GGDEF)-like protein/PAS domain S-box-containing protein